MYQADLYARFNELQRRDINALLDKSFDLLQWTRNGSDMVLDAGSGSGDVTRDILLERFPAFKQLVGVDISDDMLEFARKRNGHKRIAYESLDLAQLAPIGDEFVEKFDHGFSFHVFHWIKNQKQLFQNLYKMLKPGGDLLALFAVSSDVMHIYEKMSTMPEWATYLQDVRNIFPYQYSEDPLRAIETILSRTGFAHVVKIERKKFVYRSKADFKTSMKVINPFIKNVPKHLHDNFMDTFAEIAGELHFFADGDENIVVVPYVLANIYIKKPVANIINNNN